MSELAEEAVEASLRAGRPLGPGSASLEQTLAIASILAASGVTREVHRLGRLEVCSRLGGGGMGVVYQAYDPRLERHVAVKLLRGSTPLDRRALIAREARALARLNHPNVVAVHDIVHDERELYFVMEYVPGMTLRAWLGAHEDAPYRDVLQWFVQAGRGLLAAHEAGLVHGDFKPENVLVGDDGRARVVDFGLSRGDDGDLERHLVAGTLHYMAPEVRSGLGATPQSDQYSFCKALHEALSSRSPPVALASAVERGLAQVPSERHANLRALLETLTLSGSSGTHRSRALLLERVARLWLRGVLDQSLAADAVDLRLTSAPELVEPAWRSWGVDAEPAHGARVHQLDRVLTESGQSLLLVGPPGSGKTTAMLLLCRALWRCASTHVDAPPPVVLSLSAYEPESRPGRSLSEHFTSFLVDELVTKYGLARASVRRLLEEESVVLLLDGLDETDPRLSRRVVETLNCFRADHPLPVVVTCRDSEYEALATRLTFGGAMRVEPLDDAEIERLAEKRDALELLAQMRSDGALRDQLRNPLMLTLCASGAIDPATEGVPGWTRAYRIYVEHAFAKCPSAVERARLTDQLTFLARAMRRHNTSDLWLERLHFGWLAHRWEQIVGYAFAVLTVLGFGIGLNLAQVPITGDPLPSALTFGIGVSLASFAYTRGRAQPVEQLRWSWRRALRLFPITTVCASLVGLAEALRVNFAANMVGAAITGTILAVVFALEPGDRAGRVRVNEGVRSSLASALRVSFGLSIPVGLLFALVINPYVTRPLIEVVEHTHNPSVVVGVAVGLFVFTALFLIYGGFTVLMHWVLRTWLALRTPLPLDLEGMLERATELGLTRRVGGGYVFMHRTLLDHFAERQEQTPVRITDE